mgnify:CR=1 FL=1
MSGYAYEMITEIARMTKCQIGFKPFLNVTGIEYSFSKMVTKSLTVNVSSNGYNLI